MLAHLLAALLTLSPLVQVLVAEDGYAFASGNTAPVVSEITPCDAAHGEVLDSILEK